MEPVLLQEQETLFNNYIQAHPHGDVLQTTYWGKLKEESNWQYHPLAVRKGGQIQGAALLLIRKLPFLPFSVCYSPRGPVYSSPEALIALLQAGLDFARSKGALVWKMDPPLLGGDEEWLMLASKHNLRLQDTGLDFSGVQPRFVMVLNLQHSLDTLLANMKSKTRYNIRYAQRRGVKIILAKKRSQMEIFYELLQETAERDGFTIRPLSYYLSMWDNLMETKMAHLFLSYHEGTPLGGAILFHLGKQAWYVYGASSNERRNLQASHLIQWEMITWAKSKGCKVYDFRGVSGDLDPENPLYGLYRFKEGFGAELIEYVGEYDLPVSKGGYILWDKALKAQRWLRSKQGA